MDNKQWQLLKNEYINRLHTYCDELIVFESCLMRGLTAAQFLALEHLAHRLVGSGAAYGFSELSVTARTTELLVQGYASHSEKNVFNAPTSSAFESALHALIEQIQLCVASISNPVTQKSFNLKYVNNPLTPRPKVIVADDDPNVGIDLIATLIEEGFDVYFIGSIEQLETAIETIAPLVVVCDLVFPGGNLAGVEFFQRINQKRISPLHVIFISAEESFEVRLACARAGGTHFFKKPLDKTQLVRSVRELVGLKNHDPYRILLVDNDESLLQLYGDALENTGYKVHGARTARESLALLLSEDPEMILLDIHLPDCSGLELGKIIRQHEHFAHTPILFMSSDMEAGAKLAAGRLAEDEFISKPIEPWRLLMAVESRVKRSRLMRNPADIGHSGLLNKGDAYDPLTALPNTRYLRRLLDEKLTAGDEKLQLCLVKIDLDDFHHVNDVYGHYQADRLLQQIAWDISHCLHFEDVLCREGGDEFYILLMSPVSIHNQKTIIQKILTAIAQVKNSSIDNLHLTASVGIALAPQDSLNSIDLLAHADTALFHAKSKQDNRIVYYDPHVQKNLLHQFKLENDVKYIFERNELRAYYQPIFDVQTQTLVGFEALVRWQHPERGIVSPDQFITIVEKQGLMPRLTEWMLHTALAQAVKWHSQGRDVVINVNITAMDVQNLKFASLVNDLLAQYQFPANKLMLELTESTLMLNWELGGKLLRKLRAIGIKLAIDDFGTGYSSLSYLNRFRVDKLKIDRSFLHDWLMQKDERLISAIISLSKAMGFGVVAEGVEQQAQLDFLTALGCDQFQGYLFSRPLPPEEFENSLWFTSLERGST